MQEKVEENEEYVRMRMKDIHEEKNNMTGIKYITGSWK
jgi:hypothetical protein